MAAQELCWLTYLLTDLGEAPRSPPVLYVDNKAMLALCQEHRLEHITKHIALRYFLARELQQRGRLRLAYVATQANTADVFTKALQPYAFLTSLPSEASAVRFVDFVTACLFFDADGDLGLGPGGGEPGSLRQTTPNTHDGLFPTGSTGWPTIPSCAAESAFAFDSNPVATTTWLGAPRFSPAPFPEVPPDGPCGVFLLRPDACVQPPRPPALALPPHPPAQPPRPPLAALRPHPPAQPPCPPAAALLSQNPAQPPRPPTAALLPHPPTQLLCLPAPRQPHRPSSPAARYASPARPPAPRVPLCAPPYTLSHLDVLMRPRCRARSTHRSSSSWSSIPSSSPPACSHCRPSHSPCAELASMYPPRSPPPPHSLDPIAEALSDARRAAAEEAAAASTSGAEVSGVRSEAGVGEVAAAGYRHLGAASAVAAAGTAVVWKRATGARDVRLAESGAEGAGEEAAARAAVAVEGKATG
ncbi:unnamed protein product [Closterium sp. NIES-54]